MFEPQQRILAQGCALWGSVFRQQREALPKASSVIVICLLQESPTVFLITPNLQNKKMHFAWHLLSSFLVLVALKHWNVKEWCRKGNIPSFWFSFPGNLHSGLTCDSLKSGRNLEGFGSFPVSACASSTEWCLWGQNVAVLSLWQPRVAAAWLGLPLPGRAGKSSDIFLRTGCTSEPQKQPQISSDNNKTGKELLAHR